MNISVLMYRVAICSSMFFSTISLAVVAENGLPTQFTGYTKNSTLRMDFSSVDELLYAGVLDMGYSKRKRAKLFKPKLGTRMRQYVNAQTGNEANRFFYENLTKEQEEISLLKQYLENIPTATPLNLYSKKEQLAYWLNLYNVTLINEITKIYPRSTLKSFFTEDSSLMDEKILTVSGISLSLNDIQYNILFKKYDKNPLIMYGLYQGVIGGPNIRKKAYTGANVFASLEDNTYEFINSNRGTQFNGKENTVRVSTYYERNAMFFPDFHHDLKKHLLKFSKKSISSEITQAKAFVPNIHNWRITDLYGTIRRYEGAVASNPVEDRKKMSFTQVKKLRELMVVRAINFGGGTITVTDLDPIVQE